MNVMPFRQHLFVRFAAVSCTVFAMNLQNAQAADSPVSYQKHVLPILQANCHGCHQPAKASGKYSMTDFAKLLSAGESGSAAIVPGKPDESHLIKLITAVDGKADMPQGRPPLSASDVERIRKWIAEGAVNDSPAASKPTYDMEHPPVYTRQPVITSLDFSPDGQTLALAAFHEVLLVKADGSEIVARLVGMSERIESVKFSPDGTQLAVAGGLPARMGEIQIWDLATRTLKTSVSVTYDTVYGAKWSPDGKLIVFGCSDNSVRVIEAATGAQVLFQGAHTDWVRDTDFSVDGSHVVSVSRDMTAKLTEVATQRFVDNITSITPGALKGGMQAVAMLPNRDEVLVGGSDGVPKVYRIYRKTARKIGDDDNLMRSLSAMRGRIFGVAVSRDGFRLAAVSALDGKGQVLISRFDPAVVPENIKAMLAKPFATRASAEKDAIENYFKTAPLAEVKAEIPANIYAVEFQPDGNQVAAAGSDGVIRIVDANSGSIVKEFSPAPVAAAAVAAAGKTWQVQVEKGEPEILPPGTKVVGLEVIPDKVTLTNPFDYAQLLVTAKLESGDRVDATRLVQSQAATPTVVISPSGIVTATADGATSITIKLGEQTVSVPVEITGIGSEFHPDFIRDVNPVLSRVGCNAGTCHGAVKGKNGFKLSLRGYDPIYDVRALTDDLSSRRVNLASPDDSLMLLKATSTVPHVGGAILQRSEPYYEIVRRWISDGVKLDLASPRVVKIDVLPQNPVVQLIGAKQQLRVLATYADGRVRDVTREAFVESGNTEVASAERGGLLKSLRRGEAPMLVRYEGSYAATTLTVMGDRTGFVWAEPPANNRIDELAAAKWQRMKIQPSPVASDTDFLRRVYIDLIGLPPKSEEVKAFMADTRDTKIKRDELIDKLIGSDDFVEYWSNKWADLLQVNGKFLAREGATSFRKWIREEVTANTPYDQFARKIITATGSNREVPQAAYYKILREATATMENTTHLFLAIRFNCNKCHDHPFERWTQDQYYETAAYFAQYGLDRDPESGDRNIGGTAVEGAKPLFEKVVDRAAGEVVHERTALPTPPKFPYALTSVNPSAAPAATPTPKPRRLEFADWLTSKDNPYFAKSYVNRLWGYLFGVGIIEPIDDIRAGNPATNPELLDYLTREFLDSNFDVRHVMRLICKSRTYQLSSESNAFNVDDKINYSHAQPRRLPAEVLFDSVHRVTGTISKIPGVAAGSRAAALPDSGIEMPTGFFATFGRPVRESACECERSGGLQLGPVMALISGATVSDAIADPANELTKLVASQPDDKELVNELSLRVLNRPAMESDYKSYVEAVKELDGDHQKLVAQLKQREEDVAARLPDMEKKREESMARTKEELANHEKEIAPRIAEMEKKRQENIAAKQADIKAYDERLAAKVTEWEKTKNSNVEWIPLLPASVAGPDKTTLMIESDRSVVVETKQAKNVVLTVILPTNLKNITAFRLEAIANEKSPNGGPGRASDGNFVLTEFEVFAAPAGKSAESKKVVLHKPFADFAQENYPVAAAVNGNLNDGGKGWAISPSYGVTHWATFETKQPIAIEGGTELKVLLHHKFPNPDYVLGRFRISVAIERADVGLSIADEYKAILDTPSAQRNAQQSAQLSKFVKLTDTEFRGLQTALGVASQPLQPDPKLVELQGKLELISQPIRPDAKLLQLQADVKNSESQLGDKRLTAAQDIVWAFINTPAFLFNR